MEAALQARHYEDVETGAYSFRITTGNLAINLRPAQKLPDYRLLNIRYAERFTPQDVNNFGLFWAANPDRTLTGA